MLWWGCRRAAAVLREPINKVRLRVGECDLLILRVKGIKISHGVHLLSKGAYHEQKRIAIAR